MKISIMIKGQDATGYVQCNTKSASGPVKRVYDKMPSEKLPKLYIRIIK